MKKINELMKDIDEISKIPFKLKNELGDIYISPSFNNMELNVENVIRVKNEELTLVINEKNKNVIPLLTFCISNALKEQNKREKYIIEDILKGKDISKEEICAVYPFLNEKFSMIVVSSEKNLEEAYSLVKEGYSPQDNIVLIYQEKIVILGVLDDIKDHAISIKETIASNLFCKSIISYTNIANYKKIKDGFIKCITKLLVANKFRLEEDILGDRDIIFEEIVDSIDISKKEELVSEFNKGFKKIDAEMMRTIDVFLKSGLNLSEASKELFIHRNTLIYRIEKIEKYTGFDIKNFNQAVIFKMVFTLWKEKNKIN